MNFSVATIQIVFKRNSGHFVVFFYVIITSLSSQKIQIFNKGFLKNFSVAEEQKPKFKHQLRQTDPEGHAKYGCSTPNMQRYILKK